MEIAIGVMLSGLTELIKVLTEKWGKKIAAAVIYIILALGAAGFSILQHFGLFETEVWTQALQIFTVSIATYELLIKRVAQPLLGYKPN
jgi:hypothetical protein